MDLLRINIAKKYFREDQPKKDKRGGTNREASGGGGVTIKKN